MRFLLNILVAFFIVIINYGTKYRTVPLPGNTAETVNKCSNIETKSIGKTFTVSGTVTQTGSYCGGAVPSKEMLAQLSTPKPYAEKKFHVIKGDTNTPSHKIILSFTTDEQGKFSFSLRPGTYSIIQDEQATPLNVKEYKTKTISADENCLKIWWAKPYYVLRVKRADITGLEFKFHHRCFLPNDIPCLQYTGPYPP